MDFDLRETPIPRDEFDAERARNAAGFAISSAPVIDTEAGSEAGGLPRSTTGPMLCLMARDPHTLFAYWAIDWTDAFHGAPPADRKVHLRIVKDDGAEQTIAVEPMAGSCYVEVERADAIYSADLGYYQPPSVWNSLATSEIITTPPEDLAELGNDNFATVPFHLSFQKMIDMLRHSRGDDAPLVTQLAQLRARAAAEETSASLPVEERELARVVQEVEAKMSTPDSARANAAEIWKRQRLERVLGFGATSPDEGFGGSIRPA
ncbi:MAG: DUF4912 domain-containing protein [Chthoniobacterales bacterium]